jgi:ActR/RegA family two-component response regulator
MNIDKFRPFVDVFARKVNILVIDDDLEIGTMLINDIFLSPLLNLVYAKSYNDALNQISNKKRKWHCWIIDINLKEQNDGSSLLERFPDFDYAIIFSGISTLETASNALKKGAISAFSKDPMFLFSSDAFYNEVCKVSALSFILKGAHNEHRNVFQLLFSNMITTVEEWAHQAHLSQRQLQRVCELYTPFAPRVILPLYHSLYYLIRKPSITESFDSPTVEDLRIKNSTDFYLSNIDSVVGKLDTTYNSLFV